MRIVFDDIRVSQSDGWILQMSFGVFLINKTHIS